MGSQRRICGHSIYSRRLPGRRPVCSFTAIRVLARRASPAKSRAGAWRGTDLIDFARILCFQPFSRKISLTQQKRIRPLSSTRSARSSRFWTWSRHPRRFFYSFSSLDGFDLLEAGASHVRILGHPRVEYAVAILKEADQDWVCEGDLDSPEPSR